MDGMVLKMVAGRLAEVAHRVGGNNERGIRFTTGQQVGRRKLAWD